MPITEEEVFHHATTSVAIEFLRVRPDRWESWRAVRPKTIGLDAADWQILSERMIDLFEKTIERSVDFFRTDRAPFREKRLSEFVIELANRGNSAWQLDSASLAAGDQ